MSQTLAVAAFGAHPEHWPLPPATTAEELWCRAVAAGGQGHYASADTDLAALRRIERVGRLASLAYSTRGSLLRQLGWHSLARGWDGRALALAGDDVEARSDALVGLAADALGMGRFAVSARLLERSRAALTEGAPQRLAVRTEWVSAELAMAVGDGVAALAHSERAQELAAAGASQRHRIKSQVVRAAALCCAGQVAAAGVEADAALDQTARFGLVPLQWALASLLAGIGSPTRDAAAVLATRNRTAALVSRRGGVWRT